MVGPNGARPRDTGTIWHFETKNSDAWQVTPSPGFVLLSGLETNLQQPV